MSKASIRPRAARRMAASPAQIDLSLHIPALCLSLGTKIALHAKRHNAHPLGLDLSEWRIVQVLGAVERSTIFDVADHVAMDRGGTSRAVARLEAAGYLTRENDASDRRRSYVTLTQKGRKIHDEIVQFSLAREERLLQKLSGQDRKHLRALLNALINEAELMIEEQWTPPTHRRAGK